MSDRKAVRLDRKVRCACGAVEVRVNGRVLTMLLCSCTDCQRATGTGHAAVAMLARQDVEIAGSVQTFSRPADSGATFTRTFCAECGTPLAGISSRAPEVLLLPVGLFAGDNDWYAPRHLIFARSHRDWDIIAADLPMHDTYPQRGA